MVKRKKAEPKVTLPDDTRGGDILPLVAPSPASPMTKLYANKYTNEDSLSWQ